MTIGPREGRLLGVSLENFEIGWTYEKLEFYSRRRLLTLKKGVHVTTLGIEIAVITVYIE